MNIQKVEAFCLLSQLSGYKWLYIHNIYTLYIHNVSIICHNSRGCTPIGELTMDWDGTMSRPIAHRRPNSCSFKNACFKVTHSQKSEHFRDWFTDSMCFFLIRCVVRASWNLVLAWHVRTIGPRRLKEPNPSQTSLRIPKQMHLALSSMLGNTFQYTEHLQIQRLK